MDKRLYQVIINGIGTQFIVAKSLGGIAAYEQRHGKIVVSAKLVARTNGARDEEDEITIRNLEDISTWEEDESK